MDLITRVSRTISLWFEAGGSPSPRYRPAVFEPAPADQPQGTSIRLAFRGAHVAEPASVREDAGSLDLYGEHYEDPAVSRSFPNLEMQMVGGGTWFQGIEAIEGAPYYQVRVTFIGNAESGLFSELSALAIAWEN
jgi:hypothetical protein